MNPARSPWLVAFGIGMIVHLALIAASADPWTSITKCLLAPLLIGWVIQRRGPRLLVVALIGCFLGDLFLELDDAWFPVGMAAFAVAHVCFIVLFVRRGAIAGLKSQPWVPAIYAAAAIAMIAWCWSGLPSDIRPLVPIYALLLGATATVTLVTDRLAGLGGAFFLVSDGIIAASQADRIDPDATATGLAIMTLYLASIYLLTRRSVEVPVTTSV